MKWTAANEFKWEPRKTYHAKWPGEGIEEIKSTGWFQQSDGTFFWNEQGFSPVPQSKHFKFLILDETEQASPDGWVSSKERLPDRGVHVLWAINDGGYLTGSIDESEFPVDKDVLTHWQPLPPLPKKDKP